MLLQVRACVGYKVIGEVLICPHDRGCQGE